MNPAIREKKAYWIGGTITGLFGVGLVRLLSPELAGTQSVVALIAGFTLVIAGIANPESRPRKNNNAPRPKSI